MTFFHNPACKKKRNVGSPVEKTLFCLLFLFVLLPSFRFFLWKNHIILIIGAFPKPISKRSAFTYSKSFETVRKLGNYHHVFHFCYYPIVIGKFKPVSNFISLKSFPFIIDFVGPFFHVSISDKNYSYILYLCNNFFYVQV